MEQCGQRVSLPFSKLQFLRLHQFCDDGMKYKVMTTNTSVMILYQRVHVCIYKAHVNKDTLATLSHVIKI
jgi:hypothetical protein